MARQFQVICRDIGPRFDEEIFLRQSIHPEQWGTSMVQHGEKVSEIARDTALSNGAVEEFLEVQNTKGETGWIKCKFVKYVGCLSTATILIVSCRDVGPRYDEEIVLRSSIDPEQWSRHTVLHGQIVTELDTALASGNGEEFVKIQIDHELYGFTGRGRAGWIKRKFVQTVAEPAADGAPNSTSQTFCIRCRDVGPRFDEEIFLRSSIEPEQWGIHKVAHGESVTRLAAATVMTHGKEEEFVQICTDQGLTGWIKRKFIDANSKDTIPFVAAGATVRKGPKAQVVQSFPNPGYTCKDGESTCLYTGFDGERSDPYGSERGVVAFGEVVEVLERRKHCVFPEICKISSDSGMTGWIEGRFLKPLN